MQSQCYIINRFIHVPDNIINRFIHVPDISILQAVFRNQRLQEKCIH